MEKKYFFFDIDGTLTVKETGEILPSVQRTIKKLKENGHFVAIASGRAHYKTIGFANEIGINNFVSNGGAALTINNELIENKPLDHQKALKLINQAKQLGFGILVAVDDSIDVFMNDELFIDSVGYRKEPTRYFLDTRKKYEDLKDIYKIYIAVSKEDEHLLTERKNIGYIRFVESYLTFQHDEKDKGIEKMLEYVHANDKDVVVFGDDYNDLVMFKDKWTCIAMGNACDELKEKADFVTKENIDDGIEYACQYHGWI
jgi:hypothetical protein